MSFLDKVHAEVAELLSIRHWSVEGPVLEEEIREIREICERNQCEIRELSISYKNDILNLSILIVPVAETVELEIVKRPEGEQT